MSRPKKEVPLVDKIAQAFAAVERLQRKGEHPRGFRYTRAHDVFEIVRSKLLSRGVLVCPVENLPEYIAIQTNGGEVMTECRLQVTYTFQDAQGRLDPPLVINGLGRSIGDEALEIAQTKAQKALLKRFGIMADEQDDAPATGKQPEPERRRSRDEKPVTMPQMKVFNQACEESGRTAEEIMQYLFDVHHVAGISHLSRGKPFTEAMRWANQKGEPAPKPQAAPALQSSMPFPRPASSFEMTVRGKTETITPKTGSYSL
jgi:hypothetical protein